MSGGRRKLGGRYLVEESIGRGGMGNVHRAQDLRTGDTVAVKIIREDRVTDPQVRRLFLREVRAAARLEHPGIVRVLDQGVEEDGRVWFAMEYVQGCGLEGVDGPRLGFSAVRHLLSELALRLAFAHARDVVHRDLKPENLLLAHDARGPMLKLADFGIARLAEDRDAVARVGYGTPNAPERATLAGTVFGTPAYMAPEQARGQREKVGPGSDLYAFGVMLFEWVTGSHPFPADTVQEQMMRHVVAPVPPILLPSGARAPAPLQQLIRDLLRKDPDARPDCAREVHDRLEALDPVPLDREDDPHIVPRVALDRLRVERMTRRPCGTEPPGFAEHEATIATRPRHVQRPTSELTVAESESPGGIADPRRATLVETHDPGRNTRMAGEGLPSQPDARTRAVLSGPGESQTGDGSRPLEPGPEMPGGVSLVGLRMPPMVGRLEERSQLAHLARTVRTAGGTRVVVITADHGVGTSRLLRWMRTSFVEEGLLRGLSVSAGGSAAADLLSVVRAELVRRLGVAGLPHHAIAASLSLRAPSGGEPGAWADVARYLGAADALTADVSGEPSIRALHHRAIAQALRGFSRDRPVLLCVDDVAVPFARPLIEDVRGIARAARDARVPLLLALGTDGLQLGCTRVLSAPDTGLVRELVLHPLPLADAARIPAALLPMHESVARAIAEHVGGIPLDLIEFVHRAAERGLLQLHAGSWWLDEGAMKRLGEDSRAAALLHQRLVALHDSGQTGRRRTRLLALLALMGPMWRRNEVVEAVKELLPEAVVQLENDLAFWVDDGLLVEHPDDRIGFGHGRAHAQARTLADGMADVAVWCAWLAEARERRAVLRISDLTAIGRLRARAGCEGASSWSLRAARESIAAGNDLLAESIAGDLDEASLSPDDLGQLAFVRALLAGRRGQSAEEQRWLATLDQAEAGGQATGRPMQLRGLALFREGRTHEALVALTEAVRRWEEVPPEASSSTALGREFLETRMMLIDVLRQRGEYAAAENELRAARSLASMLGLTATEAKLQGGLAFVLLETARYPEALDEADAALASLERVGEGWERGESLKVRAGALLRLGRPAEAVPVAEEALALAQRIGDRRACAVMLNILSMCRFEQADFARALALSREALSLAAELLEPVLHGRILNNLAAAAAGLGLDAEAVAAWREAVTIGRSCGDAQNEARSRANLASALSAQGDHQEAVSVLDEAIALLRKLDLPHVEACVALRDEIMQQLVPARPGEPEGA